MTALEERIRAFDLPLSDGYDPGWAYRPSSKTDIYAVILSNERERRLWQMRNFALKLQDDAYYVAHQARNELQRETPMLQQGTAQYERFQQLTAEMAAAAKDIAELPPPPLDTSPYAPLNEQDPELAARQVAVGFNGPTTGGTDIFRSEADVRGSWLGVALQEEELEAMLAKTDFSTQLLVSYSFGQRMNASGQVMISELGYHRRNAGYTISTRLGVVPETCGVSFAESYPFVVEAVPNAEITGYGSSNFGADCGPIVSATPTVTR